MISAPTWCFGWNLEFVLFWFVVDVGELALLRGRFLCVFITFIFLSLLGFALRSLLCLRGTAFSIGGGRLAGCAGVQSVSLEDTAVTLVPVSRLTLLTCFVSTP